MVERRVSGKEEREREFWSKADSNEHIEWSKAERTTLPNLKSSTKRISLRLPELMVEELKLLANKHDIPYQLPYSDNNHSGIQIMLNGVSQIHIQVRLNEPLQIISRHLFHPQALMLPERHSTIKHRFV